MSALALIAALLAQTPAAAPVRVVAASDTQLELELRTAPSSSGGAVSLSTVRFARATRDASWRLADGAADALAPVDPPTEFGAAARGALRPLGPEIAAAEGDCARLVPLADGDAAIAIVSRGAVAAAYFADDLVPALVAAQARPRAKPSGLACLGWPLADDEGAVRIFLIALNDGPLREAAALRLAAEPIRRSRDVRAADADAARAAILFAQPELAPPDDPRLSVYRWIHGCLEATRTGS